MDDFSDLPSWQRYLILLGSGMTSSKRGIQQLANASGFKSKGLGSSDADMAGIAFEQKATKKLSDATPGGWVAEAAGNMVDPISLAAGGPLSSLPKAGALALARRAALTGALTGGLGEVKDDGSRLTNMALGGATNAAMPAGSAVKNIWAGKKAVLTGAEKAVMKPGYGGEGRTWIDQSQTRMKPDALEAMDAAHVRWSAMNGGDDSSMFSSTAGNFLDAPDMFRAYPELAKTPIHFRVGKDMDHGGGFLPGKEGSININTSDLKDAQTMASLMHELQHKVQDIEGFPQGDNPGRLKGILGPSGRLAYMANPGEIEARDTAARALMDPTNMFGIKYGALNHEGPNEMYNIPAGLHRAPIDSRKIGEDSLAAALAQGQDVNDLLMRLRMTYPR